MAVSRSLAAIACCALGAAVSGHGPDASELVQKELRVHDLDVPVELSRGKRRFRVRATIKSKVGAGALQVIAQGPRLARLLWGNATEAAEPVPTVSASRAGCSEDDRQGAMGAFEKFNERLQQEAQGMIDKMMRSGGAMPSFGGMDGGFSMAGASQVPFHDMSSQPTLDDLLRLPKSCDFVHGDTIPEWSSVMSCGREALNVSDGCLQCIPEAGVQLAAACKDSCTSSMTSMDAKSRHAQESIDAQMEKALSGMVFGREPSESDTLSVVQVMADEVNAVAKEFLPCSECMVPKFTSLAGCLGGEPAAQAAESFMRSLNDGLRSGDALKVEILPSDGHAEVIREGGEMMPQEKVQL